MAVTIFSERNRTGNKRVLTEGSYQNVGFLSTEIPTGWEIACADRGDGPINLVMGPGDSSGSDCNLLTWGILSCSNFPRVEVRKSNGGPTGLLRGKGRWGAMTWFYLPYGRSTGNLSWRNDFGDTLCLPPNVTAQAWNSAFGDHGAGFLKLHGPGEISLGSLSGRVSNIELSADGVQAIGAPELDMANATDSSTATTIGAVAMLDNTANPSEATLSTEISVEASSTAETTWDLTAGGSITSSTTVGTGEASPVKVEEQVSVEVSFSASRGGSQSTSSSRTITQTVEAVCPARSQREVQMLLSRKKSTVPMRQRMKNSITGAEFWITGTVKLDMVTSTTARVRDAS